MDGEELTEQETALYDRQIRVWGADAQRRLSKSHILVCGMKGTVAEFCKNIVLAGVGSLTLMDDRVVTEEAWSANFLIPPDENVYGGKTIAEVCCDSLKDFNPMVRVSVEKGDLSSLDGEFYDKFDVVVKLINEKCRKLSKRVAFYTVDCRDSCGEIFVDLQNHKYSKEAISVPWRALPRKASKLYFALRGVFEEAEGRSPGEISIADLPAVLKLKKELCEANALNASHVTDSLLERLIIGTREFPPVCAVVGGILGQFYKNLEEELDCMEQSPDSSMKVKTLPLLVNSPRTIMSSLPASDEVKTWKVRTNDLAVMEVLQERRAAVESGKLKGRRLFEEYDEGLNGLTDDQGCEVRSVTSYDSDDSILSAGCASDERDCVGQIKQGEKVVVKHKRGVRRMVTVLVWLAFASVAYALGTIMVTSMMRKRYRNEYEVILVPT
ncbi:SUMO-activating enzyme subunit 1A [Citrus sinensis]|uniref:SUMO-activating enzyme subunit 1A n=1 Tax=Citrus sinensis TaxID=2711 RepID=A0ACB8L9C0_CITSI|nr:SUMO-activating enzyme subunit 1A [Citrus sinensis]